MDLHEYQAKQLLKAFNIPMPAFEVVDSLSDIRQIYEKFGSKKVVAKIQILAGGRGKAGGVKLAANILELSSIVESFLNKEFETAQTSGKKLLCKKVLITPAVDLKTEQYLAFYIDRKNASRVLIACPQGGVDIESLSHTDPHKILKITIPLNGMLRSYHFLQLAHHMGWNESIAQQAKNILPNLLQAFISLDASLLEINPLGITHDNELCILDVKLAIDDNALARHPELKILEDISQIDPLEVRAKAQDLAYIKLDGSIGCIVNGAGLAMATMDLIQLKQAKAANFLDIGGNATPEKVSQGLQILQQDPSVKAILVNIFGGIVDCKIIAEGILTTAEESGLKVPLVVRMQGNHSHEGLEMLQNSKFNFQANEDLSTAVDLAIQASQTSIVGV